MPKRIEISHRTILFTVFLLFFIWLLTRIWDILLLVFVAVIIMSALKPSVDWLENHKLPRGLAIIIIYLLVWTALGGIIASVIPSLIDQTRKLINLLPQAISDNNLSMIPVNFQEMASQILSRIGSLPENLLKIVVNLFGNLINFFTTVVIAFYLLLDRNNLQKHLKYFFGHAPSIHVQNIIVEIETKLGGWVRGELILMTVVGSATYLGLRLLGIETALPLAILAGLLEIVPNIGPTLSAIPAVIIAFAMHPVLAVSTVALYVLIQFLENNLLVPQIMKRAVGINPLVSILSLMIGFRLAGTVGAILALPLVLVIQSIGVRFFSLSNLEKMA